MSFYNIVPFNTLVGQVLTEIRVDSDCIDFITESGKHYAMYHEQDCCESVTVEDIVGEIGLLIGDPILVADEATNRDEPSVNSYDESWTWTFYTLRTIKTTVTIRWYGTSNGWYSESVDLHDESDS